ncbi:MAG: T9SS C-terminal target domain-containing protein [Calditrichaeota bacterium]|nr:MAG: T9SS C-terminal target domain-containing protein [Calditrichota bacterium]
MELLSFDARAAEKTVVLFWQTASETENAGFHIFRSEHAGGPFVRITNRLIPGAGNSRQTHTYQWIDASVEFGKTYYYRLADLDFNGVMTYHGPVMVRVEKLPESFELKQNYPNPFNPETTIEFSLQNSAQIELSVFDIWGRHIVTLLQGEIQAGHHQVKWNGADQYGLALPSGLYFYRLQAKKVSMQKAMLKVK